MLVVTNGPVATAGSISSFLSIKGVKEPTVTATSIEEAILSPTTNPSIGSVPINLRLANIPSRIPYNIPRISPTFN